MNTRNRPIRCVLLSLILCVQAAAVLSQDDDDFIILDDRGMAEPDQADDGEAAVRDLDTMEQEEGDVDLSGRRAPVRKPPQGAEGSADEAAEEKAVPPPRRFDPSERVSEDLSVSFPPDI